MDCRTIYSAPLLAYNLLKTMQKYLFKIIKTWPATLPLLLVACASTTSNTAAPISTGQASVFGRPATVAPKSSSQTNNAAITSGSTQTSPAKLGGTPRANAGGTIAADSTHTVQAGETLYRIAVNNGLRYQDLAEWNSLDGYAIKAGQTIRLTPPGSKPVPSVSTAVVKPATDNTKPITAQVTNVKQYPKALKLAATDNAAKQLPQLSEGTTIASQPAETVISKNTPAVPPAPVIGKTEPDNSADNKTGKTSTDGKWQWPTQGNVIRGFSEQNKGINISGKLGQAILAAGDGKVVYSGNGLRGYGKLIIIRHDKTYLSAYAHNNALLVKEGQSVKKGQKIAEMGNTDSDQVKLHFEIREMGKPVDPSKFLDTRP